MKDKEILKNQAFMDDIYIALIYELKTEDLKRVAQKHKVKLSVDLLAKLRSDYKKRLNQ